MDYIIVGGGPTGISLAYVLGINGYKITLLESQKQLGGSWNSQWVDKKYWSENSPRVLAFSGYTKKFLKDIGIKNSDLEDVYGTKFMTTLKFIKFFFKNMSFKDYFIILKGIIKYGFTQSNKTLEDFLNNESFSLSGRKALTVMCITICDTPKNTNINNFIGIIRDFLSISLDDEGLKQYKNANKWHKLFTKKLEHHSNVKILKQTQVIKLLYKNNRVTGVVYKDKNNTILNLMGSKIVLCTQSSGLKSIIGNSDTIIKNNWISYKWFENWVDNTYYSGFGFQLHFKEKIKYPEDWCWSCMGDWYVIILPSSKWLTEKSKDPLIKTVWSCCIVDMDSKSKRLNKSANNCTKEQVLKECLLQIKDSYKIPDPHKITTSIGLSKISNKWESRNTGFTSKNLGYLPMRGRIPNLFALGCFTETNRWGVSNKELAIASTVKYLKQFEPHLKGFHNKSYFNVKTLFIVCFVIVLIFLMQ